jgi:hypothetical protein
MRNNIEAFERQIEESRIAREKKAREDFERESLKMNRWFLAVFAFSIGLTIAQTIIGAFK